MDIHELAEKIPAMVEKDYPAFRDDIARNGLSLPITIYEGKVLDGRTRQRACEEVGIEPRYEPLNGDDPVAFILSRNLHRRHLTVTQRAEVADGLLPYFEAQAKERMSAGGKRGKPGSSKGSADPHTLSKPSVRERRATADAAEAVGIGPRTLAAYERVKKDPDLLARVRAGEIAIDTAEKKMRPAGKGTKQRPAYDLTTGKGRRVAENARGRLERLIGTLAGVREGLDERSIRLDLALGIVKDGEAERWVKELNASARTIRNYAKHIEERINHGT